MFAPKILIIAFGLVAVAFGLVVAGTVIVGSSRNLQRHNPNLHPCRDCGKFISLRAVSCPHCGGPVKGG